ncbi:hypothetical protein BGZ79_000689 [Entomortierella chlamydospora]|nr:hypothetical protein BGZ79_000689 [Entomortierella chlamydospora]
MHPAQAPQQQHMSSPQQHLAAPYPSSTLAAVPSGHRSASHSRSSSLNGQNVTMIMNPVPNPSPSNVDQLATRDRPMRVGSPGPSGHVYHPGAQTHSRSRGSSPALSGYGPHHGPMPITGPVVSVGQRQGSHSRNSSASYEMASPRGQIGDPYIAHPGMAAGGGSYPSHSLSQPPHLAQPHHARGSMEYSSQQQQQVRHPQEIHTDYGHPTSHPQDVSALTAQQPIPPRTHSRSSSEAYIQTQQHKHQQQLYQQQQPQQHQGSHRYAVQSGHQAEPSRMSQSRSDHQWYQEQDQSHQQYHASSQHSQQHPQQHQKPLQQHPQPLQQRPQSYQQGPTYLQHSSQPLHGSHTAQTGYHSSNTQSDYPLDARFASQSGQRVPNPPASGNYEPGQAGQGQGPSGQSQGSGNSSSSGGGRISLSSLLN